MEMNLNVVMPIRLNDDIDNNATVTVIMIEQAIQSPKIRKNMRCLICDILCAKISLYFLCFFLHNINVKPCHQNAPDRK